MEYILTFVIIALLGFIAWQHRTFIGERKQLITALLAKDVKEFVAVNTPMPEKEPESELPPDVVSENELSDEEFNDFVKGELRTN